jgi:RHS repeat-associated protein
MTDKDAELIETYQYDPYGKPHFFDAEGTPIPNSQIQNPKLYTGREWDGETSLYYYRARYYSPKLGRFLQRDPIGYASDLNIYRYVRNNPLNFVDPYGLVTVNIGFDFGFGVVLGADYSLDVVFDDNGNVGLAVSERPNVGPQARIGLAFGGGGTTLDTIYDLEGQFFDIQADVPGGSGNLFFTGCDRLNLVGGSIRVGGPFALGGGVTLGLGKTNFVGQPVNIPKVLQLLFPRKVANG